MFFDVRKQKHDRSKAVDILVKDLKVILASNEDLFKEMTQLLTLENFRENEQLLNYGDIKSARGVMLTELKKLILANLKLSDKLQFSNLVSPRLRILINQSLNWQHFHCKNWTRNPDIKTFYYDHLCSQPNGPNCSGRVPSSAHPFTDVKPKAGGFPQMAPYWAFQPAAAPLPSPRAGWMANACNYTQMAHPAAFGDVSEAPLHLAGPPNTAAHLKHLMTPPTSNPIVDYPSADSERMLKRPRPMRTSDDVGISSSHMPMGYPGIARTQYSIEELPKNVAVVLNQGSSVTSMDFHPSQPTVLLVGTDVGDIAVWEVSSRERLAHRNFKVWDLQACSMLFQGSCCICYACTLEH